MSDGIGYRCCPASSPCDACLGLPERAAPRLVAYTGTPPWMKVCRVCRKAREYVSEGVCESCGFMASKQSWRETRAWEIEAWQARRGEG